MKEKDPLDSPNKDRDYSNDNIKGSFTKVNGDSIIQDAASDKFQFPDDDEPNVSSMREEKKQRHNQMEKKRKDKIKIGINHIGSLLPTSYRSTQKESAHFLLEQAAQFICDLQTQNKSLLLEDSDATRAKEMHRLREENDVLREEVAKYKNILKGSGPKSIEDAELMTQMWKSKSKAPSVSEISSTQDDLLPDSAKKKAKKKKLSVGDKLSEVDKSRELVAENDGASVTSMNPSMFSGMNMMMGPNGVPILSTGLAAPQHMNGPRPGIPIMNQNGNLVFVPPNVTSQATTDASSTGGLIVSNAPAGLAHNTVPITTVPISSTQVITSSAGLPPLKIMPSGGAPNACETNAMPVIVSHAGDTVMTPSLNPLTPIVSSNPAAGITNTMGPGAIRPALNMVTPKPNIAVGQPGATANNAPLQGTLVMHNGQLLLINTTPSAQAPPQTPSTPAAVGQDKVQAGPVVPQLAAGPNLADPQSFPGLRPPLAQTQTVIGPGGQLTNTTMLVGSQNQSVVGMPPATPSAGGVPASPATPAPGGATATNQSVTVNTPQGTMTLNTTPSQPNQLPSALILPNGQIVPVVTQPSLFFQQQQQQATASAGLVMPTVTGSSGMGMGKPALQPPLANSPAIAGGLQHIRGPAGPQTPGPVRFGPGLLSTSTAGHVVQQMVTGNVPQIQSPLPGARPPIVSLSTVIPSQTRSPSVPTSSSLQTVTVSSSSATSTTGTTTEAKSLTSTSSTTSTGNMNTLPSTVTAMLTPEGNIILLPQNQAGDPSKLKNKKGNRVLMPKPNAVPGADQTGYMGRVTPPVSASGLKPESSAISTCTSMTPLTIAISTDAMTTTTNSQASSQPTDILAKAAESIFSSSPNDISPSIGGFYNNANEDNPLQIDTTVAQSEELPRPQPPTADAPKPKTKAKARSRKKKAKGNAKANVEREYEGMVIDETPESNGEHSFLDQLEDEKMDEDESDINDFSDLIKMHEPLPPEKKAEFVDAKDKKTEADASTTTSGGQDEQSSASNKNIKNDARTPVQVSVAVASAPTPQNVTSVATPPMNKVTLPQTPVLQAGVAPAIRVPGNAPVMSGIIQPPGAMGWNIGTPLGPQLIQTPHGLQVLTPHTMTPGQTTTPVVRTATPSVPIVQNTTPSVPIVQNTTPVPVVQKTTPSVPVVQNNAPTVPVVQNTAPSVPVVQNTTPTVPAVQNTTPSAAVVAPPQLITSAAPLTGTTTTLADPKDNQPTVVSVSEPSKSVDAAQHVVSKPKSEEKKEKSKSKKKKKKKDKDKDKDREKDKSKNKDTNSTNASIIESQQKDIVNMLQESTPIEPFSIERTTALLTGEPMPTLVPEAPLPTEGHSSKSKKDKKDKSASNPVQDNKENNSLDNPVPPRKEDTKKSKKSRSRNKSDKSKDSSTSGPIEVAKDVSQVDIPASEVSVMSSPDALNTSVSEQSEKKGSKKSSKKSKNVIRPEDVIPDSISFNEGDLADVLDQVESYAETLHQSSKHKKSRKKSKKSHDEEPPAKKSKSDSDPPPVVDTAPITFESEKHDAEKEQRLDSVFGKSTGLFRTKSSTPDNSQKRDNNNKLGDPMDVFDFNDDDSIITIPPSPAAFKSKAETDNKKADVTTPQKPPKEKRKSKHAPVQVPSPIPPPPSMDIASTFPPTPGAITSYAPQISPNKSLFEFMGSSGFDIDSNVGDTPSKYPNSTSGLDTPVAKLSPKIRSSRKDDAFSMEKDTDASNRGASSFSSPEERGYNSSKKDDSILSTPTPGVSHARHTNLISLAQQVAPPKYSVGAVQLKPPSTPLSVSRYHDFKNDDLEISIKEQKKQNDSEPPAKVPKSSQEKLPARPTPSLSPELVIPPVVGAQSSSPEKKTPEKPKSNHHELNASSKSQKASTIDLTSDIPSLSPVGTQRELAYSAEQLFSPSKLPTMDSSASSSEKKTGTEQHNAPAPAPVQAPPPVQAPAPAPAPVPISQPSKPPVQPANTPPRGQPPSLYHQGSNSSSYTTDNAVHRGHHTVHHGNAPRDNQSQKEYFPPPVISTASSCAYKNKNQDPFHFSPQFPSAALGGGGINGPSASAPPFSMPAVTSSTNTFSFSLSSTTNSSTTSSTGQHVRQGQMYGGQPQGAGQGGRHQFTPFYNSSQSPNTQQQPHGAGPPAQPPQQHMAPASQASAQHMPGFNPANHMGGHGSKPTAMSSGGNMRQGHSGRTSREKTPTPSNANPQQPYGGYLTHQQHHQQREGPPQFMQLTGPQEDKDPHNMMQTNQNRLPTPNPNTQNRSRSSSVTSIGRSPQMQNEAYMSPAAGNFNHASGGANALTSPPLHHHGPSPDQRTASRAGFDPNFPSANPQFSPVPSTFNPPPFDPPPLTFTTRENTTNHAEAHYTTAQTMRQKSNSRAEQRAMSSSKPQGSHQSSHQGQASQQGQGNSASNQHSQQGKSSRSSGSSKSSSKKSKQHNYDAEGNSGMFDSRSMTPYLPFNLPSGNLQVTPSSPPRMNSDGPTYIPSNLFTNAPRQLPNTNTLQHKDNHPFNLFNARGQNGIGLNFQAAGFGMNHMHGNHVTSSQLTPHSNSVSVTPHMMPNFNIGNFLPEMANATQNEGLNISPIKFPHSNHMLPQAGMEQHPLQHHHQAGSSYLNRPQMPHMLHNMSINSLLSHQHAAGFEGRGVTPGINSTMGAHFPSHGHTPSLGVPFNFPGMHEH